ncbi:hypothetical protein [Zavarzinia sp.]|uniref:hypothetical protein n=1 Tax=Zavarzinia sp. TaxID=2027920 RepID=UPI0035692D55
MPPALALLLLLAAAGLSLAATVAPLALYTVTLAGFGLAHVLSEFAYVDRRFGRRLVPGQVAGLALLLAVAAGFRAAGVFALLPVETALMAELATVTALILLVAGGGWAAPAALAAALPLAVATALAPFTTAVVLSIGHNLTPLGFLWEILPRGRRRGAMALALFCFVGLPLIIASGWPRALLGLGDAGLDPLASGGIAAHLHVYVPAPWRDGPAALDLFAASAAAQGMHYLAVIVILPLLQGRARGLVPWPRLPLFAGLVALGSLVAFGGFLRDFAAARGFYGILASVHAWAELPLLALIAGGGLQPKTSLPTTKEAPLAASESSSAR